MRFYNIQDRAPLAAFGRDYIEDRCLVDRRRRHAIHAAYPWSCAALYVELLPPRREAGEWKAISATVKQHKAISVLTAEVWKELERTQPDSGHHRFAFSISPSELNNRLLLWTQLAVPATEPLCPEKLEAQVRPAVDTFLFRHMRPRLLECGFVSYEVKVPDDY